MWGRRVLVFALLAVALLLVVGPAEGAPGALDPSFGSGGLVTTTLGSGGSETNALAVQPDGKILAGGETSVGSEEEFALARYTVGGKLDTSFGSGGKLTTAIGSQLDRIRALVLQPDGRIVAAGGSYDGSEYEFALARYNPDGSLDTSFGIDGKVVTPIAASGGSEAYAVALQPDGKIVAGGGSGDNRDFVVVRYNADGSLDTSFGTGGTVMTVAGYAYALALQPDGKIIAAGGCCAFPAFALARYNPDGSLDTNFGTGGIVTTSTIGSGIASGVALQPDGKIVVGGTANGHFALLRFSTDGTLDPDFGSMVSQVNSPMTGQALLQQPNGKLVLAGYYGTTEHEFALARYDADGSLDAGFGVSGIVKTPLGANGAVAAAVTLEPDGKIVAGGTTQTGSNVTTGEQFALARYLAAYTLGVSKDGDGSGAVTSDPAGIDCGTTCSASVAGGSVTLRATPAPGSRFIGWAGGGCSGIDTCQVQMSADQSVTATFSLIPERLTIATSGAGAGRVTSRPTGIGCGYTCSHSYPYGTTITLTATPARWSTFKGWSGACSGTDTCSLKMKQAQSATARFAPKPACIVPPVKGKSLQTARRRITRARCHTGKITHRYSTIKKGFVISQKPHPRRHLHNGTKVSLVISKGRRT